MKIVVLDGFTLNPGDICWDELALLGELTVYDRTDSSRMVVERVRDAEIVLTNKTVIDRNILIQLPQLKYVGVLATGCNVVDIKAASESGVIVTNIPGYSTMSVAQTVFALLLEIANGTGHYVMGNSQGCWSRAKDFCYYDTTLVELAGKQIGIVGLGNIGIRVAKIADAFGMKVCAFTSKPASQIPSYIQSMSIDNLFGTSDVVSLHCPLTESNIRFVDQKLLSKMKSTSILINTARGGLIDEDALASALNDGTIFAAGLDVLSTEPPSADNPLLRARNCYITPHIAWATVESRRRLMNIAVDNVRNFIYGCPSNVVNKF